MKDGRGCPRLMCRTKFKIQNSKKNTELRIQIFLHWIQKSRFGGLRSKTCWNIFLPNQYFLQRPLKQAKPGFQSAGNKLPASGRDKSSTKTPIQSKRIVGCETRLSRLQYADSRPPHYLPAHCLNSTRCRAGDTKSRDDRGQYHLQPNPYILPEYLGYLLWWPSW